MTAFSQSTKGEEGELNGSNFTSFLVKAHLYEDCDSSYFHDYFIFH